MRPGPSQKDDDDSIAPVLQEVIANEVKARVPNAVKTVSYIGEPAVEPIFCAPTHGARGGIGTVVYDAVEHVIHLIRILCLSRGKTSMLTNTSRPAQLPKHWAKVALQRQVPRPDSVIHSDADVGSYWCKKRCIHGSGAQPFARCTGLYEFRMLQ